MKSNVCIQELKNYIYLCSWCYWGLPGEQLHIPIFVHVILCLTLIDASWGWQQMDLMVLLWKQEGTEAGSLTFLCLLFKKTLMSACSGNLLSICIYFYSYMEISGTLSVMGNKWVVVGTVLQRWEFWGTDEVCLSNWVHLIKQISKPWILGICISSFDPDHKSLLSVLTSRDFGKCCLQFVPSKLQIGAWCNSYWFFSCLESVWLRKTRWGF